MKHVHVMVAVLRDADGRVLINQRPSGKMQAGRWEFPGGKLERGEGRVEGLRREIHEELGVQVDSAHPLIRIRHQYPEINVLLDVFDVPQWQGVPESREGQALKWVAPEQLPAEDILEADAPVISAIRLPDRLLVTPEPRSGDDEGFLAELAGSLAQGVTLVQFRAHSLDDADYCRLARKVISLCHDAGALVLLNRDPSTVDELPADGVHLSSGRLDSIPDTTQLQGRWDWLSASCHDEAELSMATRAGAHFALLGPVKETATHPGATPLGWQRFEELVEGAQLPVFALGGMAEHDCDVARERGGQGIAAIRAFWKAGRRD